MLHKKQAHQIICDIVKWNTDRDNPRGQIDLQLEYIMLSEELNEFMDANTDVDRLDALIDLYFVLIGSLHKLGLTSEQIVESMQVVLDANKRKLATKSAEGKSIKPDGFVSPEATLQLILDKRPK